MRKVRIEARLHGASRELGIQLVRNAQSLGFYKALFLSRWIDKCEAMEGVYYRHKDIDWRV